MTVLMLLSLLFQWLEVGRFGVPRIGVVSVGDVPKTSDPVPVSSEIVPAETASKTQQIIVHVDESVLKI